MKWLIIRVGENEDMHTNEYYSTTQQPECSKCTQEVYCMDGFNKSNSERFFLKKMSKVNGNITSATLALSLSAPHHYCTQYRCMKPNATKMKNVTSDADATWSKRLKRYHHNIKQLQFTSGAKPTSHIFPSLNVKCWHIQHDRNFTTTEPPSSLPQNIEE